MVIVVKDEDGKNALQALIDNRISYDSYKTELSAFSKKQSYYMTEKFFNDNVKDTLCTNPNIEGVANAVFPKLEDYLINDSSALNYEKMKEIVDDETDMFFSEWEK